MKIEKIIFKNRFYFPFIYLLTILGGFISNFYKITNPLCFIVTMFVLPYSCFYLVLIYDKFFSNRGDEFTLIYIKFFKIVGYSSLILNIILISLLYFSTHPFQSTQNYVLTILISFSLSLGLNNTLRKRLNVFNDPKIESQMNIEAIITCVCGIILVSAMYYPPLWNLLNFFINIILFNLSDYFSISIAIIMLCATLSVLSFTYSMIDNQEEKNKMNENGKGYFTSTILSFAILVLLFISSSLKHILLIFPEDIMNWQYFLLINTYAFFIMTIFILTIFMTYYIIKCSISSLKILKFF